ncbi:hypothetical protein QVD17_28684 [Tagetes erecta]|uniref:Uncharacterized protein n=1 Tax=Tagetes erecta TaxID=13708 RepID=A0AAD8KAV4_TARER|nr:hypothetical protein QVD17_28684 [Tagetes erecta]
MENYRNQSIDVTLWEEKAKMIDLDNMIGKALVVTAMIVTYYKSYQLESTTATTVEVNPDFPGLQSYLEKFANLGDPDNNDNTLQNLTIAELQGRAQDHVLKRGVFLCYEKITTMHDYRGTSRTTTNSDAANTETNAGTGYKKQRTA